jgi:hypothetical protein
MIDKYLSNDLFFYQNLKVINNISLSELKSYQNKNIYEYLNPELSYPYNSREYNGGKVWTYKHKDDPEFKVVLKWSNLYDFYVLDFLFDVDEDYYSTQKGLEGKYYLDTLCKIFKDEIIPYIKDDSLYFNAYDEDNKGNFRKNAFSKILDKFLDKTKYNIDIEGFNFLIKRK